MSLAYFFIINSATEINSNQADPRKKLLQDWE